MIPLAGHSQQFKGQWKGEFTDKSGSSVNWGGQRCEYILELESAKDKLSGYSYTYFMENGKRFYTICRLEGKFDRAQKALEIREVERTKTNVPKNIQNCFQLHKLTYFKKGSEELLSGDWVPVSGQEGDCGYGETRLTRRVLTASSGNYSNKMPVSNTARPNQGNTTISAAGAFNVKAKPVSKAPAMLSPVEKNEEPLNNPDLPVIKEADPVPAVTAAPAPPRHIGFERRESRLLKTIEVENQYIKVDIFDNGEIDGDSITLFYNDMMLVTHRRLTDKASTFTILVDDDEPGQFEMYAENLGTIPPNSAVMVITDGNRRYEVRVTSDLKKSGAIRFVRKKKS